LSNILTVQDLWQSYGENDVLCGVNFKLDSGSFGLLLGENGAGKSTLMRCIASHIPIDPRRATVSILGENFFENPVVYKQNLGFALDAKQLPAEVNGHDLLSFYLRAFRLSWTASPIENLLDELAFRPFLGERVDQLSFGNKQKLAILCAIVGRPRLVLLDESFNGLDPLAAVRLKSFLTKYIRENEAAVLLSSHNIPMFQDCASHILFLKGGRIKYHLSAHDLSSRAQRENVQVEAILYQLFCEQETEDP
jgi:ABC-2 type transport system ATP-binding protein